MLQLSDGADSGLLDALDRAREQIGDWHDLQELAKIAEKTLEPHTDRAALKKIAETGDRKFDQALRAAEEVKALSLLSPKPAAARAGFAARSSPA